MSDVDAAGWSAAQDAGHLKCGGWRWTPAAGFVCDCGATFGADDVVCPNYPTACRGCVACRTDEDHEAPCICDCEERS